MSRTLPRCDTPTNTSDGVIKGRVADITSGNRLKLCRCVLRGATLSKKEVVYHTRRSNSFLRRIKKNHV